MWEGARGCATGARRVREGRRVRGHRAIIVRLALFLSLDVLQKGCSHADIFLCAGIIDCRTG